MTCCTLSVRNTASRRWRKFAYSVIYFTYRFIYQVLDCCVQNTYNSSNVTELAFAVAVEAKVAKSYVCEATLARRTYLFGSLAI